MAAAQRSAVVHHERCLRAGHFLAKSLDRSAAASAKSGVQIDFDVNALGCFANGFNSRWREWRAA